MHNEVGLACEHEEPDMLFIPTDSLISLQSAINIGNGVPSWSGEEVQCNLYNCINSVRIHLMHLGRFMRLDRKGENN